jgi:hypothetical protein
VGSLREEDARPGILEDHLQALTWQARLERQIGAAGAEHGKKADHHLDRTLRGHAHQHLGPDAEIRQVPRESRRPLPQLAVGDLLLLEDQGHRVRRPLRLGRKQCEKIRLAVRTGRVVPGAEELMMLRLGEDRQGRKRQARALRHRPQQHREALQQARRGRAVEQVRVVLEREAQAALPVDRMEHQIERRRGMLERQRLQTEVVRPELHPLLAEGEGGEPLGSARLLL